MTNPPGRLNTKHPHPRPARPGRGDKAGRPAADHQFATAPVPYGLYDVGRNRGHVCVGRSADTAPFAVNSLRSWWRTAQALYTGCRQRLLLADGGGSNSSRGRLWKRERQNFATETGLTITVCHSPPGTSKWNGIEHWLFSFISVNGAGEPCELSASCCP